MFDFAKYLDGTVDVRLRVECVPTARDDQHPIRLVITDDVGTELAELLFTPSRAYDTAGSLAQLLGQFMPARQSWKLADGLRKAAITVWAARN
jgi:hypothetical protein